MADKSERLVVEHAALRDLDVVDLVADWHAGEQIDISLLLEMFEEPAGSQDDFSQAVTAAEIAPASGEAAGDVFVFDPMAHGPLSALYDDLTVPQTPI